MSFQQGLSGLNGASKSLDVIGNNVSNASTVGFKNSQAQFADIYANSLNGVGGLQAGIGVKVAKISQQFSQGNIETSTNPLDLAINGGGFFRMNLNGTTEYTRNGQFELDKNGYLVNAQSAKLTGYNADSSGVISTGTPQPIKINTADLAPVQTTTENIVMNLDSHSAVPTVTPFDAADAQTYNKTVPINVYDSLGNTHVMQTYYVKTAPNTWAVYAGVDGTEITKLDATAKAEAAVTMPLNASNANAVVVAAWAGTQAAINKANVDAQAATSAAAALPNGTAAEQLIYNQANAAAAAATAKVVTDQAAYDAAVDPAGPLTASVASAMGLVNATAASVAAVAASTVPGRQVGTVIFDSNGSIDTVAMSKYAVPPQTLPLSVTLPIYPATGATSPFTVAVNLKDTTQYGGADPLNPSSTLTSNTQDGYTAGHLTSFATGQDGTILGTYSNGASHVLGQVVLANFADPNGLTPLGNNAWAESPQSGQPIVGVPDTGSLGVLESSSTESSNVDLTAELVNMITAQRVYQANAQSIKTEDSIMQTLVNLR